MEMEESSVVLTKDTILDYLTNNQEIIFKSQQIGEADLTKEEKTVIASDIYNKSKLNFLMRFGRYLQTPHLIFFQQFTGNDDESCEIGIVLKDLLVTAKSRSATTVRNRRYQAMKQMLEDDQYFSETEMMKRNPLLYEQLVGRFLTEAEKKERDRIVTDDQPTLVKILLEGIDRDEAEITRKEQETMEADSSNSSSDNDDEDDGNDREPATYTQWGEFEEDTKPIKIKKKRGDSEEVTLEEQKLLKEEFIMSMYDSFIDGKDREFNYEQVDSNQAYDDIEMKGFDEEDKYFDSEEPKNVDEIKGEESEDELDIFMSAVNQSPAVAKLTKEIEKL